MTKVLMERSKLILCIGLKYYNVLVMSFEYLTHHIKHHFMPLY